MEPWGVRFFVDNAFSTIARGAGVRSDPDSPKLPSVASGDDDEGVWGFFASTSRTFVFVRSPSTTFGGGGVGVAGSYSFCLCASTLS